MPILFLLLVLSSLATPSFSQTPSAPSPAPDCNGILLSYSITSRDRIRPFTSNPSDQPYAFASTATILNSGTSDLVDWSLELSFKHRELLVSLDGAVLSDSSDLPYNTTDSNSTSTSLTGYPTTTLKTPIETANDLTQIQATINIKGTLFGVSPNSSAVPSDITLGDSSYVCSPIGASASINSLLSCCVQNPNFVGNDSSNATDFNSPSNFLPARSGDLTIEWDVIQTYGSSYLALVTIENHNSMGRLDDWRLSWEWQRGEFIYSMRGAYPDVIDISDCIFGKPASYYQQLDFTKALNCEKTPTILDLPIDRYNDTQLGLIQYCCRNGTILPAAMDPSQSKSAFQLQVFKMPPDINATRLYPPANFKITGISNPEYKCGQAIRIKPKEFPNPNGLDSDTLAIASWQVVCNITKPKSPKCCVSFSAFYNDSVVPCPTCACGCANRLTCNKKAEAMLLPPEALLVPFDNRTQKTLAWADIKHYNVPKPLPCGDFCGVSINWHIASDAAKGWSARVTLFNWEQVDFADWFLAVTMNKTYDGYQQMYSFNGTAIGDRTIFMQGNPGLNYLMGEVNGTNPSTDPMVPGKQQSVISFTKTTTPGVNIIAGDGYPTKVYFNGEECAMPDIFPSHGSRRSAISLAGLALVLVVSSLLLLGL